jgi:hypothetical protein
MPIIRSLRTRRAEREKATKLALEERRAAEEARLRALENGEGAEAGENEAGVEPPEYVNNPSDEDEFELDESLEMTLSPDGVPILNRK